MKAYMLIGTLLVVSLVVSCAAEPEDVVPTTVAEDVASDHGETAVPADAETEPVNPADGGQEALEADASTSTSTGTPDDAPVVEVENGGSPEPTAPTPEAAEPSAEAPEPEEPEAPASELPEPDGPWIDPREPDFTKTVPPPQR